MPERSTWGTLATSLATLAERVRRPAAVDPRAPAAPRYDGVRRLYVRAARLEDALRRAAKAAEAPAPAGVQRVVHRIVDGVDEDETAWLALLPVHRIGAGPRVLSTHAVNVAVLSIATARALGLSRDAQAAIGFAAFVHDVRRRDDTASHDVETAAWLFEWAPIEIAAGLAAVAAGHAAPTGRGLAAARDIDLATRIVRIADAYDVLCGRDGPAGSPDLVLAFLLQGSGDRFDGALLKVFARVVGIYPPGTAVRLRDGAIAVVVQPSRRRDVVDRPVVRVVVGTDGVVVVDPEIVDLITSGGDIATTVDPTAYGIDAAAFVLGR